MPTDVPRPLGICPDCHGEGSVALLITRSRCKRCNGTGRVALPPSPSAGASTAPAAGVGDLDLACLALPPRARAALTRLGLRSLRDVTRLAEDELRLIPGLDDAAVRELKAALHRLGLKLQGQR